MRKETVLSWALLWLLLLLAAACQEAGALKSVTSSPETATPTVTPTVTPTPTQTPTPTPTLTPEELASLRARQHHVEALAAALGIEPVSLLHLWESLAGFNGKNNAERERYVTEELFPKAGLTPLERQLVEYRGPWGPEYGTWENLHNIIAVRQGSLPEGQRRRIILGAHFDKVTYPGRSPNPGTSQGILDNGTGVAAIAAIAAALRAPKNDLVIVAFATEEPLPHLNGSRIYFNHLANKEEVLLYANFDVLGKGDLALVEGSAEQALATLAREIAEITGEPLSWRAPSGLTYSDYLSAQFFGLPTLGFTATAYETKDIHVPEDNLDAIALEVYYRHYVLALRIVAYLDAYLVGEPAASSRPTQGGPRASLQGPRDGTGPAR